MGAEGLALATLAVGRGVEPVLVDDDPAAAAGRVAGALGGDATGAPCRPTWTGPPWTWWCGRRA